MLQKLHFKSKIDYKEVIKLPKREISATEQRQIVAKNLNSLLEKNNKKKIDVFKDLEKYGVSETTVYSWFNGKKYPRIDKIQLLADYFGVSMDYLMERQPASPQSQALARVIDGLPPEKQDLVKRYVEVVQKE